MSLDWDRFRIFGAVAAAGSFTRASETLSMSQSAISRQVSALEDELGVPLFHRHARGLLLTEHGESLKVAAKSVARTLASAQNSLGDQRNAAAGHLKINTTVGIGTVWLVSHLSEFQRRYPEIDISLIVTDGEVDLSMREADVAIRLQRPKQADLIQRPLMTAHTHLYAARELIEARCVSGEDADLDNLPLIAYSQDNVPPVDSLNWVLEADLPHGAPRRGPAFTVNNVYGMLKAAECGLGIASLPDYLVFGNPKLMRVLPELEGPTFTAFFVYPVELRSSQRVEAFRDFLLEIVAAQPVW